MINRVTKNNLAKLLATENIDVEHRQVSTAAFDVKNRRLILPIWENVSNDVYDLLVGHEVGHALFTPQVEIENLCKSIDENNAGTVKSFLNVVEDARIEKKIKRKFNGLRKNFNRGYSELLEKDFFGINGRDLDSFTLIDRINIQFKLGSHLDVVPFTPEEKEIVSRIENLETFEEVVDVVRDIYTSSGGSDIDYTLDDSEFTDSDEEGYDNSELSDNEVDGPDDGENDDSEEDSEEENDDSPTTGNNPNNSPPQESETQTTLDEELKDLVDENSEGPNYIGIPELDFHNFVVDHSVVYDEEIRNWVCGNNLEEFTKLKEEYNKFKNDSVKTVNYLVKEFELKKNAEQHLRAQVNKSGVLDVNKLHSYRFCEDVFKRITTVPGGKNHGLILFLDWSGSMSNTISETIKQLLNLVYFCRKVNIPFDVYSFHSDQTSGPYCETPTYKHNDYVLDMFHMKNLFSSRQKGKAFEDAALTLFGISKYFQTYNYYSYIRGNPFPNGWSLGGTPLNEAILVGFDIVKNFRNNYGVSKVNVVLLTDGEGTAPHGIYNDTDEYGRSHGIKPLYIRDERFYGYYEEKSMLHSHYLVDHVTKIEHGIVCRVDVTRGLLEIMIARYNVNVIGYYITTQGNDFKNAVHSQLNIKDEEFTKYSNDFKRDGFIVARQVGYTAYFIIKGGKKLDTTTEKLEVEDDVSKRVLTTAFKKHNKSKLTNRVVLNKFVELIS